MTCGTHDRTVFKGVSRVTAHPRGNIGIAGGGESLSARAPRFFRPTLRRGSRPRRGGGVPCPACPERGGVGGVVRLQGCSSDKGSTAAGCSGPCRVIEGGQLRPGQYALPPRSGVRGPPAVVDVALRGCDCPTHVQAWRRTDDDDGYNIEADVLRYNAGSGNNRLTLVPDFLVENIKLRNSTDNDRDDGGGA